MPRIYVSPHPDVPIPRRSIFTHVFSRPHDSQLPAYIDAPTGKTLTRADVYSQSLQLAWGLRNILNQPKGSTMAIFSPNSLWWPVILLGGIAAGLRITTISSAYTPSELAHQIMDSNAYYIFAHPSLLDTLREALNSMGVSDADARKRIFLAGSVGPDVYKDTEGWQQAEQLLWRESLEREELFNDEAANETAILCYSSGTTSRPKGVELTHYNIVSIPCITEQDFHYLHSDGAVMLSVLPFSHIYGLVKLVLNPFFLGAPQVIMSQFQPDNFCANIERYKVTLAFVVPPILVVLANHPALKTYDLSSLKILLSGAAPLGESLALAVHARLRSLGANVMFPQGFGMSETGATTHLLSPLEWKAKAGSIGPLVSNVEARIVLDDGELDAADGEPGELWIRGPGVMKGYFNNPEATKDAITPDRWFKTGDIAVVDKDGYFTIVDRKKELIKYKGFQVPPSELEGVLLEHPKVADAGVLGMWSDADATEYPRAYIVPHGGVQFLKTPAECEAYGREIQTWVRKKVARHKYLRGGVVIVDSIPKSVSGKILRRQLRELASKDLPVTGMVTAKLCAGPRFHY